MYITFYTKFLYKHLPQFVLGWRCSKSILHITIQVCKKNNIFQVLIATSKVLLDFYVNQMVIALIVPEFVMVKKLEGMYLGIMKPRFIQIALIKKMRIISLIVVIYQFHMFYCLGDTKQLWDENCREACVCCSFSL